MSCSSLRARLVRGALAMLIAAAAAPSVASAAEAPLVPLLTGGLLTYSGTADARSDWSWSSPAGWTPPAPGGHADTQRRAKIAFETSWLIEGRYGGVPVAKPMFELIPHFDAKVDLGSGTFSSVQQAGDGKGTQTFTHSCAWAIRLDEEAYAAPLDDSGRAYQLSPILGREEHETRCDENQTPSDVFNAFESDPIEQFEVLPAEPARTTKASRPVRLDKRLNDCGVPNAETTHCDHRITGSGTISLECALCVDDIRFEHPELPGGSWVKVPDEGTFDGNRVRITAKVRNATKKSITAPLAVRDMTHGHNLRLEGLPASITVAPGQTVEVAGEWDSSGYAWEKGPGQPTLEHDVAFLSSYGGAQRQLKVRPKPVVLVHGWASDASTWTAYPNFLRGESEQWISHAVAGMDTDPGGSRSVFDNAAVVDREVRALRESLDADHVDIVAHSMGGLISRAYIHRSVGAARDGKPWVSHLLMLGTPNMGSPCANVVYPLMSGRPTLELTPAYVQNTFNPSVTNRKGVPFSIAAGTAVEATCYDPVIGDMVVSVPSAVWEVGDRLTMNLLHTSMTGSKELFDRFVKPRLEVAPGAVGATSALRARAAKTVRAAAKPKEPQVLATKRLTLKRAATVAFTAERGARVSVVVMAGERVASELVAPNGKVVAAVRAGTPESREVLRSLSGGAAKAGRWKVRLKGSGKVAVAGVVTGGKLRLTATATQKQAGGRVSVVARLAGAGAKARVTATVRPAAGGKAVKLTLKRRGKTYRATTKRGVKGANAGVIVSARAKGTQRIVAVAAR